MLDIYCNGVESEVDKVKRKTDEEFHFWLEKKIKAARTAIKQKQKAKQRGS